MLVALNFSAERAFFIGRIDSVENFFRCERGLELSEYAVAAALVALAAAAAFPLLGTQIGARITTLAGYTQQ